ncbi:MAG: right-handed parallel beta-helix repeat-containing protein, partial [Bacteroidia bacterium]|nr:right-handed parallel beta-helix repeat-containing protein [Bacteroidia bacterium]
MAIINRTNFIILLLLATITCTSASAKTITVGPKFALKTIKEALKLSLDNDTIIVDGGIYQEGNILIDKSLTILGKNNPVIDGQKKQEVISIKANFVVLDGFTIKNSGYGTLEDPCGVKVYDAWFVTISNNILDDNFFSIYIQYGKHCIIKNNTINAYGKEEQEIGNGIHCWKSDSIQIIGNKINGHRDGIYLEFVTGSIIWRNISSNNIRYGLHFMFSHNDTYISNVFKNNGAGVAVMFTNGVKMINNWFEDNWGDAAYGLLLKEISDSYIFNNRFLANTTGIFMEGT